MSITNVAVGDTVQILVSGQGGPSSSGDLTIESVSEAGVVGYRDVWYGRLTFFTRWDVIVGFDPTPSTETVHMAACEACPPLAGDDVGTCERSIDGPGGPLNCVLRAGHRGRHRDRSGAEWTP